MALWESKKTKTKKQMQAKLFDYGLSKCWAKNLLWFTTEGKSSPTSQMAWGNGTFSFLGELLLNMCCQKDETVLALDTVKFWIICFIYFKKCFFFFNISINLNFINQTISCDKKRFSPKRHLKQIFKHFVYSFYNKVKRSHLTQNVKNLKSFISIVYSMSFLWF